MQGELDAPDKEPYRSVLTRQADGNLSGRWSNSTGSTGMLKQSGNQGTGTICCQPDHPNRSADVSGTFDGKNYVGIFHFKDADQQGTGTFIYALNGGQLDGSFKVLGGEDRKPVLTRQ